MSLDATKPQGYAPIVLSEQQIAAVFNKIKHRKVAQPINGSSIKISCPPIEEHRVPAVDIGAKKTSVSSSGGKGSSQKKSTTTTASASPTRKRKKKTDQSGVDKRIADASL